ncbi:hypothetical protein BX666DRAFT_2116585 [Dichotomocladium elegans]|nr:hypothetical protein BX666DRAFT_2116585 [Dichotomocladium elegans]
MKDADIKYIEIVPSESILDFMGQARLSPPAYSGNEHIEPDSITLKGEVLFALNRPLKIRSMAVKFKGVVHTEYRGNTSEAPVLPKLKQMLFARTTLLPAGDHSIPFLLEVPNIYPQSLSIKRASIAYKVEVSIAVGLQKKSITAEHTILVRRHLLRCMEMAPLVETQILEHTVPAKFHYEIDAPQIVCLEQGHIPVSVKYLCFATQKPVRNIRTQLKQIELYSPAGSSGSTSKIQTIADSFMMANRSHQKYVKRTVPALLHSIDHSPENSAWKHPIVLRHSLQKLITPTLQSPMISIYHELEITFQFEHQFESIKAKIPIVIASIPPVERNPRLHIPCKVPQYHFEVDQARLHDSLISVRVERPAHVKEVDPTDDGDSFIPNVHYSILGEPQIQAASCSRGLLGIAATPIAQRRRIQRGMRPIDVDLANGLKKPMPKAAAAERSLMKSKNLLRESHRLSTPPVVMHTDLLELQHLHTFEQPRLQQHQQQQQQHRQQPHLYPGALDYMLMDDAISLRSESTSQTTRSSSADSFDDVELRSRPPSIVYTTAPGLPCETTLRPAAAVQRSLVEETFMQDLGNSELSPLTTIASSSILSRNSSMVMTRKSRASIPLSAAINFMRDSASSQSSESDILTRRALQSGTLLRRPAQLPSQGPPPKSPLPPVPSIPPLHSMSASALALSSTTTAVAAGTISPQQQSGPVIPDKNPYAYLQLPPLPSDALPAAPAPAKTTITPCQPARRVAAEDKVDDDACSEDESIQNTTRRMTKLYVEDSDDEVIDPLPPIPEKHRGRYSPVVDTSNVPLLPRLSLGTAFGVSFD